MKECQCLRVSPDKVIHLAYHYRWFTIEYFISPDGELGKYPTTVYGKYLDPYGNRVTGTYIEDRKFHRVPAIQL